jgi:hypothetical protein
MSWNRSIGGKVEGGSGGRLGHSNMTHWDGTEYLKEASVRRRRAQGRALARAYQGDPVCGQVCPHTSGVVVWCTLEPGHGEELHTAFSPTLNRQVSWDTTPATP